MIHSILTFIFCIVHVIRLNILIHFIVAGDNSSAECTIDASLVAIDTPLKVEVPAAQMNGLDNPTNDVTGTGVEGEAVIVLDTPIIVEDTTDF